MAETDGYLRALINQTAAEEAFFDSLRLANDLQSSAAAPVPAVSLMITSRQRTELRERGVSDESIRLMSPAVAHAQLGLAKPAF